MFERAIGLMMGLGLFACGTEPGATRAPDPGQLPAPVSRSTCLKKSAPIVKGSDESGSLGHWGPATGFCLDEIRDAERAALRKLGKRIGELNSVQEIKVWDSGAQVSVSIQYLEGGEAESAYFACHYHSETSTSMYCHSATEPGPEEPVRAIESSGSLR